MLLAIGEKERIKFSLAHPLGKGGTPPPKVHTTILDPEKSTTTTTIPIPITITTTSPEDPEPEEPETPLPPVKTDPELPPPPVRTEPEPIPRALRVLPIDVENHWPGWTADGKRISGKEDHRWIDVNTASYKGKDVEVRLKGFKGEDKALLNTLLDNTEGERYDLAGATIETGKDGAVLGVLLTDRDKTIQIHFRDPMPDKYESTFHFKAVYRNLTYSTCIVYYFNSVYR